MRAAPSHPPRAVPVDSRPSLAPVSGLGTGTSASRSAAIVLVVDPDEACREAVAFALRRAGVVAIEAADPTVAGELLAVRTSMRPDALLVDVELVGRIRANGVPTIVMSDHEETAGTLLKPPHSVEVLGAVATAGGFGDRRCVLVEDDDGDRQRHWVARLSHQGAVVAGARSGVSFTHAAELFRPNLAVVASEPVDATMNACRTLGALVVITNDENAS